MTINGGNREIVMGRNGVTMKRLVVALCISLVLALQSVGAEGTVVAGGAEVTTSDSAYQLLWPQSMQPLDDGSGAGAVWQPVSLRFVITDDMNVHAEIRNVSETPATAPDLNITLLVDGQSLGTETVGSANEFVPPGRSAYYQTLNVFGGSLFVGDWDDVQLSLTPETYFVPDPDQYASLSIEGEKITNNGPETLGEVSFIEVIRDANGIFTSLCQGPSTGANILPGRSVRARGLDDTSDPGGCGFSYTGMPASESLGIGGPFTAEYVIARIRPPK